ncbi:MAG TPA: YfhO family protein [Blastocatellia bacterium]|nr:YfhO family protein [Blastocatellia bacterium]
MKQITERRFAGLIILLLPLAWFLPAVAGRVALVQGDGWPQQLGVRVLTGELIASGALPLWNPYVFGGMPLLAAAYPGALYPLNWLFALLPPGAAMNAVVIATFYVALIGAYRFARAIGSSRLGALVTGAVFAFGGFMVMSLGNAAMLAAAAWLPWILLALEKLRQRVSWRRICAGALLIALQSFACFPQMSWHTALLSGAYFLFAVVHLQPPRWRFIAAVVLMACSGALISMIQMLPLRELQQQGARTSITYENFSAWHFPLRQIAALIFPYFYGGASLPPYHQPYRGAWGVYVTAGYVGLSALLLALIAIISVKRRLVWFWSVAAVVALLLSFGDSLPFGVNHLLYRLPVFNLFRTSSRHLLEFDFALAVLAGMGLNRLERAERKAVTQTLRRSALILGAVVLATAIAYLTANGRLMDAELLVPLLIFTTGLTAVWWFGRRQTRVAGGLLLLVVICDLASFGQFLDWRTLVFDVSEHLADPPTVSFIKARESDLSSFRLLSYAPNPFDNSYELLNHPNVSIARGLQSVNGYDELRLLRPAAVLGGMSVDGIVTDRTAFSVAHQGFNLLNVKYLFIEHQEEKAAQTGPVYAGVRFSEPPLSLSLSAGSRAELMAGGAAANELVIVSALANSAGLSDGQLVLKLRLHAKDGRVIEREMQAGRDTSEWAWERADVRAVIRHRRAQVIESWPVNDSSGTFAAHRYLARFTFDRAEIDRIEVEYAQPAASLELFRASLFDSATQASSPLSVSLLPAQRWRRLTSFYGVEVYENLKALPRAWFVRNILLLSDAEALRAIREGKLPDGRTFDPAESALLQPGAPIIEDADGGEVKITAYRPQRIELQTSNQQAGFLVLSEIDYPGWRALIDGTETAIHRTDYTLRGIAVPAGEHRIEFICRPASFSKGLLAAALGVLLLPTAGLLMRNRAALSVNRNASTDLTE